MSLNEINTLYSDVYVNKTYTLVVLFSLRGKIRFNVILFYLDIYYNSV